jgi:PKHD-type hydroxylase
MILHIPEVLTAQQVTQSLQFLSEANWADGRVTSGYLSLKTKDNKQTPDDDMAARRVGTMIVEALERSPLFMTGTLPLKVVPPIFNRYEVGNTFGNHVDNAIRQLPGSLQRLRTDISATLFLSDPNDYDGGELMIEDTYGMHSIKLAAGDLILYPSTSLHHVKPVMRGVRFAAFFWIQSMVRDDSQRTLLFDLDMAIQQLRIAVPEHVSILQLTNVYHNLVRQWADV